MRKRPMAAWWLAVLLALCAASGAQATAPQAVALNQNAGTANGMVRVSLSSITSSSYSLTINGIYTVNGIALTSGETVRVDMDGGMVYFTRGEVRQAVGTSLTFARQGGGIRIAQSLAPSNTYPGNLTFLYSGGVAYVVCTLHIEDYVYGVLPYEMDNAFPLEALKAQAIAARTYAARNQKSGGLYDVSDTVNHQVFRGVNYAKARCIQAVDETKGIVMRYGGSYIDANFGASNGGQTELNSNAWGSSRVGYLSVKDDPYDLANPSATVKSYMVYYSPAQGSSASAYSMFATALAQKRGGSAYDVSIEAVQDIVLHTPRHASPSRLYTQMRATLRFGGGLVDTVDIPIFPTVERALGLSINTSDNELFTVTREADGFRVASRRLGHGVGMSQRGAQYMAQTGMDYRQILGFYYTGVELAQMQFTADWTTAAPTAAPTQPAQGGVTGGAGRVALSNPSSRLNLRRAASTDSAVLSRLSHGAQVEVLGQEGAWYQVRYGSLIGYLATAYVQISRSTDTSGGTLAYVTLQSGRVNLRAQARATAAIVGDAPNGAAVRILSAGDIWTQIEYAGVTGFVMTQYLTRAQPQASDTTAIVRLSDIYDVLNLRMNPSTSSPVLAKLPHGTRLTVQERGSAWTRVAYQGVSGYVMNAYIGDDGAVATAVPTVAPTTRPDVGYSAVVSLASGTLNLRAQPNMDAAILAKIPNRAQVGVIAEGDSWCAVTYGVHSGYVSRRYLSMSGTPEATADTSAAWIRTSAGDSVNLRGAPSLQGAIVTKIPHGTQVRVIETGAQWTSIQHGAQSGYVASEYLSRQAPQGAQTTAAPEQTGTYAYIATDGGPVNLRAEASTRAEVLTELPYGTRVRVITDGADWIYVQAKELMGYVAGDYLSLSQPQTRTAQTAALSDEAVNSGQVRASGERVLLRREPTLQTESVGTLAAQASVEVISYAGAQAQWLQVRSGGLAGYLPRDEVSLSYRVAQVAQQTAVLHAQADQTAQALCTLGEGTVLTVLEDIGGGWARVRLAGGLTGFVQASALQPL